MASSNNGLQAYQDSSGFKKFEASRIENVDRKRQRLTGSSVERVDNSCSTQDKRTHEVTKRLPSSLNKDIQWKERKSDKQNNHECIQNTEKRCRQSFRKMPDENNDVDVYALNTNGTHGFHLIGQRDLNSQIRSASYKPTKFYSSMDYDMSVPSKYLNGKQVPSNGEIDIEVCVKPTTKYVDHTTHTQCRFTKRPYRSELVVQLGTKKGTVYQSINKSNSDVTKDCDSDITEQKTLGITCLRVEHDIHIPVDVVIANDSDQNIENIIPVADSDSCYVKPTTCLPRTNGYIKNVIPVHTSPGSDNVPARTKSLATTGQPELSQKLTTTKSMSNTIIDRRGIGLISNDTVVNFDRTSRDNQDPIYYINASLKHNNQYLLHCAKDSRPSDTSFSENNPLACSDLSDLDSDEYSYKNSLEEIHSILKEATLMENIQFKTEVINNGINNCSKTDMQSSLTNCSGVVACDTIPEDDQCSTDNNRSKTNDNQCLIDYFRVSGEENQSTIGNALLLENNRSKTKDDEPSLTDYSQIEFDNNPAIKDDEQSSTINDDDQCSTDNNRSKTDDNQWLTDYFRVSGGENRSTIGNALLLENNRSKTKDDEPSLTDYSQIEFDDNPTIKDDERSSTINDNRCLTNNEYSLTDYSGVTTSDDNRSLTDEKCYPTRSDRSLTDKPGLTDRSQVTTPDDNRSLTDDKCYPTKIDRSLTDKPGLTDHSQVTTLDYHLSLTDEESYPTKCDRSLTDKPGITDYSRVANDNEICLTGKNNENIFSAHSETSSDDNQSLTNYELSRDATSVSEYEKVRDREETQQSSVAFCAYESDQDEDRTYVYNLSENGSDVTSPTNKFPGADYHVTNFVNSDIKPSNISVELCTDHDYVMSKPDKGEKSAENNQMFAACRHTKNEMPNSLRHSTRQTDTNKVLLTKEVALGNCCTPGSENNDELLNQLKSFSNNNLPNELDNSVHSETDNICTRGCPMTAFSVESTENDSTDTESESSQEYEDTTEADINDSSESEYETASSNFNKCSDVSEYEYDVDEDLTMPRPVVTIDVEMVTPPEFAFRPQSRVVEQGNTAKFICVLKGCPKPEVTWFKNGIILRSSKKYRSYEGIENMFVLEVTDVDPSDTGEYVCTASNAEGRIYASAELTIEDPPLPIPQQQEPFFMDRLEDITVSVGSDVQFSCQVGGNPAPQILWFHNGVGLKRLQRFTFSRSDTGQCTLSMPDVRHEDEGEVACIASNILGRATCCAYLNVKDSPKSRNGDQIDKNSNSVDQNVIASTHHTQPNVQNIVAIEGTTTKFKCSVIGNPKPSVTWYKDGLAINTSMHADGHYRIVEEGFTHSLEITRTEDSDAGHYYCTVSNSTGAIMCSCFLLVNDRKENSFIVDSVISPMTISTKTESITRTIQRELPVVTTVESKMTLDNTNKITENNDLESSETTHESTVLLLNLQRDDNINNVHSEVLETTSIEHDGAISKEMNGHAQSEDSSHIKLSDNITLQCISPGMNINIEGNSSKKETCEETIKDNFESIDIKEVSDEPSTHSFCVEKKFTMNNEPIQRKIDIKFTPIKLARHMELDPKSPRSYDLDNGNATDDSSDSTDQLLHSLQLAQNSVELDSDDDIMNIRSYQYSTTRTYNHPQNSEDDMERASRLSEKVDSCMDIVNTVLNLASLDSEGEKELRMRLEELRSGLSSSGSSVIDDQELSIRTLSVTGSSCNTPLSIEDNTLSVDLKETGHADQPEVSLDDDISDIEILNRSSSSVNLEHVSSPRQNQKIRLKRHDPKFPEMAANLLDISNPYEMIKEAESKNKDSSVEMMADVLSSQIVIEGLYDYSTSKINTTTQNSTTQKIATIGNAAKNHTHYLKNVSSFADNVVAEILIDAALRIKDVTKSMNKYKTKEMLDTNVHHGSSLSHKVLNEIIKVASENASQTNNIDLEIFDDVLHEIMLQESAEFLNPIVSKEVRCCSSVENCLENTSDDTLELRPTSDQKNDVVVEEFHSEIRIPIHQPVISISSTNTLLFSTKEDNLQKTTETQQETVNSKILDTHQEIIIPIQLPSPTVPTVFVNEEPKEEKEASTTLKKVKARNILSGFLGNAMLLEQQQLKPTVKLSRSQSDRIQRPVQTSHDKLKRNSTDPDVLLKRCLSERRKQAKESTQSNELKQTDSFMPSPNEPEIVTLLQLDLYNTEQVTDANDVQHVDNNSKIEPTKVVQSLTIDLCNVEQTTDDNTESTSQDDANVLDKKDDLEQIRINEHTNDENELSIEPEHVLLSQTIDKNNSHDNESMDKQNVISSEAPTPVSNEHILEAIKEIKDENVQSNENIISEKQEEMVKSSLSRSMSARIPIRRKSHSFISKDPRYLSWQAQRVNHKKSTGEPRTVPSRTQSLILPRTQFSDQQIVEEKEIKQSVIDTIYKEQKGDEYDQEIVKGNDEADSRKTEEEKDSIGKQVVENPIEPTQENENNLNNHVTTSEQLNEYKTTVSDQENRDEFMSENKLSVQIPEKMKQRERPISSLISMFETTIQSSPRNSKVHEFGLTFKHDEKEKKAKPVNRSQSMMCRRTETIIPRKPDNRLSMDGSVHLNQLERLNVSIDITKPEETGNEKIEVETQNRSLSLSDVSKKYVNSSVEDVTFETGAERLNSSDHEDDDVFSLPIMEDSSCDEELLDSKSKSTSRSEQSLISTQSSSESASFESAPTFIQPLSPVEVQDGESVRLEVKVVGNPEPEIKWFRDGNELQEDQHYQYVLDEDDTWSLILAEATPADAGEFTCQAENCHGSVSCKAYLNVEDPATVTEDEISSELGDSRTKKDTETVARLLKEHKEKRLRNGSLSTSGAEEEMFCRYIVLENYQSDKLNIQQGDEVEVLESQSEERWLIKHIEDSSMIGYVPASLLEKLDEDDSGQSKRNSVKLAIQELFPEIVPTAESMQENKLKRKLSAKERLLTMRQYSDQDDVKDSFDMCVAIASYIPVEEDVDHIPLVEGQYVEILDSDGAIEWLVQTKPTKVNPPRRGWVPASHLMKDRATMVPGQTESLNRMISRVILDESDSDLAGTKKQEALIKRRYVLEELLQTERAFVKNMMFCLETYLPLVEDQNAPPAVKGKKDVLFLNFEKICDFHKNTFVKELEECGNDAYSVGRAFIKWQCNFEYHVQYCKNKPRSENCLTPTVKACFDEYLRSKGIVDKFSLSDYLIKPVQRLTKYQLLLKEVVKYTSRAKEDCIELEMALNVMMQVPKRANDLMHISLIEGFQGNINDLGKLYRQEDYTVWTGKQKGRGKERHVFLFKDLIMLTKIKKDPRSEGFTYAYKNHMTIPGIGMTEESRDERCFELWYGKASSSLSMTLQAKTKYVKEAWVKEIRSLLEQKQMEMLEAKASVERIYGALHQTRSSIRSASSISSLNSEPGTLSNSSLLSKSSESLTFNETSTSSLGATSSLSVPARLHGDSFTSLDRDSPPRDNCEDLEIGGLYEISDDFIAGGMCGLELSKGELVKLVEAENNNVCIVQSMPSPECCTGEEGSVPPYLLRRRKSLEAPVSIVEKPETVSVNVGDNATFTCTFTGMPTPTTDWYFKGHVIKGQSSMNVDEGLWISTITILNVNIEDSGKYRCVINNAFSTKSCMAHLHVAYVWGSPSITTIESSDDAILEFDDDTIMSLPDNSPSIATDHLKTNIFEINSTITNIHNNNVNKSERSIEHIVEKDIIIED
ncbi:uncharacterized protein [Antedon mediterranea]|uniref:uncharacterized protein isoform X2 n=1 Tax=Antedon mediterranea TaxID=105859 RepID=UPI003AF8B7D2